MTPTTRTGAALVALAALTGAALLVTAAAPSTVGTFSMTGGTR